jgi:hypothetical protein
MKDYTLNLFSDKNGCKTHSLDISALTTDWKNTAVLSRFGWVDFGMVRCPFINYYVAQRKHIDFLSEKGANFNDFPGWNKWDTDYLSFGFLISTSQSRLNVSIPDIHKFTDPDARAFALSLSEKFIDDSIIIGIEKKLAIHIGLTNDPVVCEHLYQYLYTKGFNIDLMSFLRQTERSVNPQNTHIFKKILDSHNL